MARRSDPARAGAAVLAQADLILEWLGTQPPSAWRRPSALPGWTVADLAAHLTMALGVIPAVLGDPSPDKPITVDRYVSGYAAAATQILERDVAGAAGRDPAEILAGLYDRRAAAAAAIADPPAVRAVRAPRGPIAPADFLTTRIIEMVVHADDLSRSLPAREPGRAATGPRCGWSARPARTSWPPARRAGRWSCASRRTRPCSVSRARGTPGARHRTWSRPTR